MLCTMNWLGGKRTPLEAVVMTTSTWSLKLLCTPQPLYVQYTQLESIRQRPTSFPGLFPWRWDSREKPWERGWSEALDDSTRFAPPEVKTREIIMHECFSFLKRDDKLEPIHVTYLTIHQRHLTIRLDSHGVDPHRQEVKTSEIIMHEHLPFLKRGYQLESIRSAFLKIWLRTLESWNFSTLESICLICSESCLEKSNSLTGSLLAVGNNREWDFVAIRVDSHDSLRIGPCESNRLTGSRFALGINRGCESVAIRVDSLNSRELALLSRIVSPKGIRGRKIRVGNLAC